MEESRPGGRHRGPGVSRTRGALLRAGLAEGHLGRGCWTLSGSPRPCFQALRPHPCSPTSLSGYLPFPLLGVTSGSTSEKQVGLNQDSTWSH